MVSEIKISNPRLSSQKLETFWMRNSASPLKRIILLSIEIIDEKFRPTVRLNCYYGGAWGEN